MSESALSQTLLRLLGPEGMVALCETRGGTRLYVPKNGEGSLAAELGADVAQKLVERYGGGIVRVPLARELRARHYRARGLTNAEIAVRLGMTETGVDKMFHAMPRKPVKGSGDPRQPDLFS